MGKLKIMKNSRNLLTFSLKNVKNVKLHQPTDGPTDRLTKRIVESYANKNVGNDTLVHCGLYSDLSHFPYIYRFHRVYVVSGHLD